MTKDEKILEAISLFDYLAEEIYYGFNMKIVLREALEENPALFETLQEFVELCRAGRSRWTGRPNPDQGRPSTRRRRRKGPRTNYG